MAAASGTPPPRDGTRPHGLDVIQAIAGYGNWGVDGDGTGRLAWARLAARPDRPRDGAG